MYDIIIGFLLSSVKYLLGVGYIMARIHNPFLAISVSVAGSVSGVFFFTFLGRQTQILLQNKFGNKTKRFSTTNRLIIKLKTKGGIVAVAALTPILLSIPIGCIASVLLFRSRGRTIKYIIASIMLWTLFFFGSKYLLSLNLKNIFS